MAHVSYGRLAAPTIQQGGAQVMQNQPSVIATPGFGSREKYKGTLYGLGITEIVMGCFSCLLALLAIAVESIGTSHWYYDSSLTVMSQGIWCGVFLIVLGILGIRAKISPSPCMYNANMALGILSSCAMGVLIILSSIAAVYAMRSPMAVLIIHSILAFLGFIGLVITIVHSAYCCAGVCCYSNEYQGAMICMPQQCFGVQQPQQMVRLANGQFMMLPPQNFAPPTQNYSVTSMPTAGPPVMYQPGMQPAHAPTQVPYPTTSSIGVPQPVNAEASKDQGNQAHGLTENPPSYSEAPAHALNSQELLA